MSDKLNFCFKEEKKKAIHDELLTNIFHTNNRFRYSFQILFVTYKLVIFCLMTALKIFPYYYFFFENSQDISI